ncbi:conjugal transfer protein TraN, partial [Zunongwangia sp. F297]|nr:conjugal transfer protein TraN [Zunongwangia sp. F297]
MKSYILILAFIFAISKASAQESITLDTICANDQKNVALFFPEPIRQGITGSD